VFDNHYRFTTRWRVESTPEEVYTILGDPSDFVRWWPAVWLRAAVIDPGDDDGMGRTVRFVSKGWLPYLLHWTSRIADKEFPSRITVRASGDFEGEGRWWFRADGPYVDIDYLWIIEANKPMLRHLSFLLKPLFGLNHRWAMARGEESLRLELARRRARTPEELARVPPPPQPTFLSQGRRRRLGLSSTS